MTLNGLAAVVIPVLAGVVSFLLTQSDVVVAPALKVALGAANVALTILALRLNIPSVTKG